MCKIIPLIIDRKNLIFKNTQYISNVLFLYSRFEKFLNDDYAEKNTYSRILKTIEDTTPFFFIVLDKKSNEFAGFIYLDNLTGNTDVIHGAEISTCFEKKYWGDFTRQTALIFFDYCFNTLKLKKLKAQIYPFNTRVKNLLQFAGFKQDGILRAETLKNGCITDIESYSLTPNDLKFVEIN